MYSERRCSPVCFLSTKTEGKAGSVVHGSLPLRSQQQGPACCSLSRGTGRSTTTSPSHLAAGGWGSSRSTPGLAEGRSGGPGGGAEGPARRGSGALHGHGGGQRGPGGEAAGAGPRPSRGRRGPGGAEADKERSPAPNMAAGAGGFHNSSGREAGCELREPLRSQGVSAGERGSRLLSSPASKAEGLGRCGACALVFPKELYRVLFVEEGSSAAPSCSSLEISESSAGVRKKKTKKNLW